MSYSPPARSAVDFDLPGEYGAPSRSAVDFSLDANPPTGAISAALSAWSVAIAGLHPFIGAMDATISSWGVSAAGAVGGISGAISAELSSWSASASGNIGISGAVSATLSDWGAAASGTHPMTGGMTASFGDFSSVIYADVSGITDTGLTNVILTASFDGTAGVSNEDGTTTYPLSYWAVYGNGTAIGAYAENGTTFLALTVGEEDSGEDLELSTLDILLDNDFSISMSLTVNDADFADYESDVIKVFVYDDYSEGTTEDTEYATTINQVSLASIVYDVLARAGFADGEVELCALADTMISGVLVTQSDAASVLAYLTGIYLFSLVEVDGVLTAFPVGGDSIGTIPATDMGAYEATATRPAPVEIKRKSSNELVSQFNINYLDEDQDYEPAVGYARLSSAPTSNISDMSADAIAMDADTAASLCSVRLAAEWLWRTNFSWSTGLKYSYLTPGDVIDLETPHGTFTVHVTAMTFSYPSIISFEGVSEGE